MPAIDVVQGQRIANLDHVLQTRGVDLTEHRPGADEFRDISHFHAEMSADRLQGTLKRLSGSDESGSCRSGQTGQADAGGPSLISPIMAATTSKSAAATSICNAQSLIQIPIAICSEKRGRRFNFSNHLGESLI